MSHPDRFLLNWPTFLRGYPWVLSWALWSKHWKLLSHKNFVFFLFPFFVGLGIKLRASYVLGKSFTTELHLPPTTDLQRSLEEQNYTFCHNWGWCHEAYITSVVFCFLSYWIIIFQYVFSNYENRLDTFIFN